LIHLFAVVTLWQKEMSAPDISCYENVIGLYPGDCPCYNCNFGISDSGLYISDLLEPKFIDGLLNCDQGDSVCELMEIVRDLAVRYFIADSNALLLQGNKLKRKPFQGGIGLSTYTKDLSLLNLNFAGVTMMTPIIKSGYLKIKKIGLLLNTTTPLVVDIIDRNGTILYSLNLTATANTHTINDVSALNINLPLYDDYLDYIEYFFQYQVAGFQPKNNGIYNCSSCIKNKPGWGNFYYDNRFPWVHWVNVAGFNTTGVPNYMDFSSGSDQMNGMTFQVELGCLVNEVFCKDQLDFEGNTLAQAMAVAIQHKAGALFIDKILNTTNLNRQVMLDREQQQKNKESWEQTYKDMITYITQNIEIEVNDCFECKDVIEMIQGGIFA